MPFPSFLKHVTKRLRAGVLAAFITVLGITLLSACAEVTDDTSSTSTSSSTADETAEPEPDTETTASAEDSQDDDTMKETAHAAGQGRAGGSTPGTALTMLDELEVKGRGPKTGYDADLFKWRSDADHNGCDTRNDVLRRDLRDITLQAGTKGCVVIAGDLAERYKGETYAFDRDPNNIDIDHIVARSNAWQTGAATFDEDTLKEFGNDPLNLLAVSSSLNRQIY